MPTIVADPALPAAAPADPGDNMPTGVANPSVPPRSSGVTASINRFGTRVVVQLARLADRDSAEGLLMTQAIDLNGRRIVNVSESNQLLSLVTKAQAEALADG